MKFHAHTIAGAGSTMDTAGSAKDTMNKYPNPESSVMVDMPIDQGEPVTWLNHTFEQTHLIRIRKGCASTEGEDERSEHRSQFHNTHFGGIK